MKNDARKIFWTPKVNVLHVRSLNIFVSNHHVFHFPYQLFAMLHPYYLLIFEQNIINSVWEKGTNCTVNGLNDCKCLIWIMKEELLNSIFYPSTKTLLFHKFFYLCFNRICKNTSSKSFLISCPSYFRLPSLPSFHVKVGVVPSRNKICIMTGLQMWLKQSVIFGSLFSINIHLQVLKVWSNP